MTRSALAGALERLHAITRAVTDGDRAIYSLIFMSQLVEHHTDAADFAALDDIPVDRIVPIFDLALTVTMKPLPRCFPLEPYSFHEAGWNGADLKAAFADTRKIVRMPEFGPDWLGVVREALISNASAQHLGQFLTPWHVCQLMAAIEGAPGPGTTVNDPCVGTGRTLMAAHELCVDTHGVDVAETVTFSGCDIDRVAIEIAGMNLFLAGAGHRTELVQTDVLTNPPTTTSRK